jgi:mRNA interferase MazF
MKRGDIFAVVLSGDYGKPRPAIIIQSDTLGDDFESVIVCPLTSFTGPSPRFRFTLEPNANNGLRVRSQAMVEKPTTVSRRRVGQKIGRVGDEQIEKLDTILAFVMGLIH